MSARFFDRRQERDLFEHFQDADKKIKRKTKFFPPRIKKSINVAYENLIFVSIGFIMCCIIFFSLGVEKGKHDAVSLSPKIKKTEVQKKSITQTIKNKIIADKYIIQLAAFTKLDSAQKEIDRLKKGGHNNINVKDSGSYYQLYIGGFKNREDAENSLSELKKRYRDCYIKKL